MKGIRLAFAKLVILCVGHSLAERCDEATTARVQEGNLGQSGDFNWLGVLHVHLHDEAKIRVAMTGIVLIKIKYAIANADDVVRIPQQIFKTESKAMFLPSRDTPWTAKPTSFVTHPEYDYSTLNTIAVIELDLDDVQDFPLNPICLPSGDTFNTSRYLYLTGFTDENQKLEKVIYNIQYLDKKVCEEFYHRAGLSAQKRVPSAYLCGYAPSNHTQCVWDNGMVLVSNVTGYFNLIGFGIHGPGCAAPARFIDLFSYFPWISSVISPDEVYDDYGYRRRGDDEFIPVHELFTNDSLRKSDVVHRDFKRYPFEKGSMQHHIITPSEDDKAILIIPFNDTWERSKDACSGLKMQVYKEFFQLKPSVGMKGVTTYKLSMYDKHDAVLNCVRLTVDRDCKRSEAILSFKEVLHLKDEILDPTSGETPEELFQFYAGVRRPEEPKTYNSKPYFKPAYINEDEVYRDVKNYDLYIRFEFFKLATLEFEMFAVPGPLEITNKTENSTKSVRGMVKRADHMSEDADVSAIADSIDEVDDVPETQSEESNRKAKAKLQKIIKSNRGMVELASYMSKLREAMGSVVGDDIMDQVPEKQNAARGERVTGDVVATICLFGAGLRRALYIY